MLDEQSKIQLTEEIRAIRTKNNRNWMDLTALAQRVAPEEAARVLGKINECDLRINVVAKKFQPENGQKNLLLVEELKKVREENNENWMELLRIAFRSANTEATTIMQRIAENDSEVNVCTSKMKGV